MPLPDGKEQERRGILGTANLMAVAARTAPKSGGADDFLTAVVTGAEIAALAADMEKLAVARKIEPWSQQAKEVGGAKVIVRIGVRGTKRYATNCEACGYKSCEAFEKAEKRPGQDFESPTWIFKALDPGIALGSAVKTTSASAQAPPRAEGGQETGGWRDSEI